MSVAIISDSAATLPREVVDDSRVSIVPMSVTIDGATEPEGARPLELVASATDVSTAAPTPGDYDVAIQHALETADRALVLTVASTMSASHASALIAARPYGDRVHVVDTSTAAGGEGLAVVAAADAAAQDASLADTEAAALRVCDRVRLIAALRSFEQLARSGRVPEVAEWARRRLRVVPVFEFVDGKARPRRPALSWEAALDRITGAVIASARATHATRATDGAGLHIAAMHASAVDAADQLLTPLRERFPAARGYVGAFGTVMVAHTGTGLAGLAWYWDAERAA